MPANALLSDRGTRAPRDLVAAAILVYAIEHCIPAEALGFFDERLEELAAAAAPVDSVRLLLIQHELDRPLSGLSSVDATRLRALRAALRAAECPNTTHAERVASIADELDQRESALTADVSSPREDDIFAHRPDSDWESIEKAAYEGALRFPPARHLVALPTCVEQAARKVARWERNLRAQGTTDVPLDMLRKVARKAGKQCAMDAWKSNHRALASTVDHHEHYESSTLSALLVLSKLDSVDYQVLLLGELAFGTRMRGQEAPHRTWLGLTEGNYRVKLMRARGKFALALSISPRPRGDRRDVLEGLALASLILADAALGAHITSWHDPDGDGGRKGEKNVARPEFTEHSSSRNMSQLDPEHSSVLALVLRDAIHEGAALPDALFVSASAGLLDELTTRVLAEHDPARMARMLALLPTVARRRRADALHPYGKVAVRLMDGARQFVLECMGGAALPGISLSDPPASAIARLEDRAELVFPDRSEIHFLLRCTPERPNLIDMAVERVPESVTSFGLNLADGSRAEELTVDAARMRLGLVSPVFAAIPVGIHRVWASNEDGQMITWSLCVEPR